MEPARGILLGIVGGLGLWALLLWALWRLLAMLP